MHAGFSLYALRPDERGYQETGVDSLPLLLPVSKNILHHFHCTEVAAHRAGIKFPVPCMDRFCCIREEREGELFLPVKPSPRISHLPLT